MRYHTQGEEFLDLFIRRILEFSDHYLFVKISLSYLLLRYFDAETLIVQREGQSIEDIETEKNTMQS